MIVDDLAKRFPKLKQVIDGSFVVRVPWRLLPEGGVGSDFSPETLPLRFLQKGAGGQLINWDDIRLPYDNIVIVSQYSDPSIIIVKTHKADDPGRLSIDVTVLVMFGGGLGIKRFKYMVFANGDIGIPFNESLSPEKHRKSVQIVRRMEMQTFDELGFDNTEVRDYYVNYEASKTTEEGRRGIEKDSGIYCVMVSAVAALFSCKNMEVVAIHADKAIQAKRAKRGLLPLYTFHTLTVRISHKSKHAMGGIGEPVAIHWVRGHFKRYTESDKLFGKHIGLYWWQPHLAGMAHRVVDKDYAIQTST